MTIEIIHGEDITKSRDFLFESLDKVPNDRVRAQELTPEKLLQLTENTTLFMEDRVLVIENLLSKKDIKDKKPFIEILSKSAELDKKVILWESKKLTATDLKPFHSAQVREFPIKTAIFNFLDSLGTDQNSLKLYHQVIADEPVEKVFSTIGSRLHLLFQTAIAPEFLTIEGFYKHKILSQTKSLGLAKIRSLINKYLQLEYEQKSGGTMLTLSQQIELFLSEKN